MGYFLQMQTKILSDASRRGSGSILLEKYRTMNAETKPIPNETATEVAKQNSRPTSAAQCFALINNQSGGRKGLKMARSLRRQGIQCWNLLDLKKNPDLLSGLAEVLANSEITYGPPYILVGGGDGTNGWALQTLEKAQRIRDFTFLFASVPLGSGNDLSRCLGWGVTYPGTKNLKKRVAKIKSAKKFTLLDRWDVRHRDINGVETPWMSNEMVNYFTIGYEAEIQKEFLDAREHNPERYNGPFINKCKYAQLTLYHLFKDHKQLAKKVEIVADGKRLKLPRDHRSIVINNIPSMAQGVRYWGTGSSKDCTAPRLGDKKFELMSGKNFFKVVKISMGVGHYRRLAQPHSLQLKLKESLVVNIDGDAWVASPGTITFTHKGQVLCPLGNVTKPRGVSKPTELP